MNGVSFGKLYQFLAEWIWMANEKTRECTKNPKNIRLSVEIYYRVRNLVNPSSSHYQYGNLSRVARDFRPANCLQSRKKGKQKNEQILWHNIKYRSQFRGVSWDLYFLGISTYVGVGDIPEWYQLSEGLGGVGWGGVERRDRINTLEGVSFLNWLWGLNTLSPETPTILSFGAALHTEVKLWHIQIWRDFDRAS